ncbi:MAG: NAD(P)/FAD-dependent oxidoreductase [Promethearchaeota archaeon]|nr:MAG: NAD(P)/FAD-dependent oxidoreductase [Candidatus Lokiarchaeota archaeon]
MSYDVVVSGAGPAGSKCAEVIAKAGYNVALIEKDINFRKPCGGGIPRRSIYDFYPQLKRLNLVKKNYLAMFSADGHKLEQTFEVADDDPIVMDRLEFDNLARNVALDAGAELFDKNVSYDFMYKNLNRVGIKTSTSMGKKDYLANIIIVADGMSSKLANKSGLKAKWKPLDIGIGKAEILEGESNLNPKGTYFLFKKYGYGWIFPIDNSKFNIGTITYHENNLKYNIDNLYKEFLHESRNNNFLLKKNYKVLWSATFPEPATGVLEDSLYGDNILLIGDTAGFVAPISGEGIHYAIESGQIAGETAINALEREDFTKNSLKEFKKHPKIKKIIRTFKFQRKFVNFFYEKEGANLNKTFKMAEENEEFKEIVKDTFIFGKTPPKDFILTIKGKNNIIIN